MGVLLGYSIVWILFALIISVTQIGLLYLDVVDMMGKAKSLWLSAALLIAAGAFQFTRAKEVCHGICHSPMSYFIGHWNAGFVGGVKMGLSLGVFLCWLLLAVHDLGLCGWCHEFSLDGPRYIYDGIRKATTVRSFSCKTFWDTADYQRT